MAIKKFRPITPTLRHRLGANFDDITTNEPEPSLTERLPSKGGRNSDGRTTMRYQGGGHKRLYRFIDFKRDKDNIPGRVATIEYDPNRSSRIALINYKDGEKRYILAPKGLEVGMEVLSGEKVPNSVGNCMQLKNIPLAAEIHNIALKADGPGQMVRSAGGYAILMAKEGDYAHLKLPSKEIRLVRLECRATLGIVGNIDHNKVASGKAGRSRWLGIRSHVRGVAKNPVDHPMGGGEGKTSGGRHPCSPWGQLAKGLKTRNKKKLSSKYIVKRRDK